MADSLDVVLNRLTLRQLRLVAAVARHRNIQRAAGELGLTQPTVTKAVQEVEKILGVDLFERTNRGVVPTGYCTVLTRRAHLILAQLRHAGEEIRELQEGTGGRVVIGALLAASARLLPEAIAALKAERPGVSVTVLEGTNDLLMPALRNGEIDFVAGRLPEFRERHGVVQEALYSEIACFVVRPSHPLAGRAVITLADLVGWEWILPRPETTLRRQIEKGFYDAGLEPPHNAIDSLSLLTNLHLTTNADFVGVWPYQAVRPFIRDKQLVMLPVPCPATLGPVGVSRRVEQEALSPAAEALLGHVRTVARAIERSETEWRSVFNL